MENNGHMELEHPSVWLIKQEVSRKPSNVVREAKDRTGKAIHDSRLQTLGEHLTASDMASWNSASGMFNVALAPFYLCVGNIKS